MKAFLSAGILAVTMMFGAAERSEASVVMSAVEVGSDVIFSAVGTYDFSDMRADQGYPYSTNAGEKQ